MFLSYVLFFYFNGQVAARLIKFRTLKRGVVCCFAMDFPDRVEAKREKARLQKQRERATKRGRTLPCDLCGCNDGPELHRVSSLTPEVLKELCQITNRTLSASSRVCCRHFEDHPSQLTQNVSLKVKTGFASLYWISKSTRPPLTPRPVIPHVLREPTKQELKSRLERALGQNKSLKEENASLTQRLRVVEEEVVRLRGFLPREEEMNEIIQSPLSNEKEVLRTLMESNQKYWCGFGQETLSVLLGEWQEYGAKISSSWNLEFFYMSFLLWLRHGWTFVFLSHLMGIHRTNLRRQFFDLIESLQPWCMQHIGWPSFDEWKYRTQVNPTLTSSFPRTLFFFC